MKTTKQKLVEWGWTNGNGQPLSWKYWWTYWRKKEEDEERRNVRHNELMRSDYDFRNGERGKYVKKMSQRAASRHQHEDDDA